MMIMRNPAVESDAVAGIGVTSSTSTIASPSAAASERETFIWMQGRMFELLLRHDTASFERQFREQKADPYHEDEDGDGSRGEGDSGRNAELQRYRDLAVIVYLRAELFEYILPLIKRRMSFEAPRQTQIEPLPARGRVDWGRTAAANWRDWPGEVPLEVHTRQRRRHFTTPENLLTVVTIMEYRQTAQRLLDNEAEYDGITALRHPLNEIMDECNRELGFIQFAGLLAESEAIVQGYMGAPTTEELEAAVEENLLPGSNSAYYELLEWRHRLFSLRLLDRTQVASKSQTMLGNKRDNYLYQLWLFYEIFDFLNKEGKLKSYEFETSKKHGSLRLTYDWGGHTYGLQHDQAVPSQTKQWHNAPGVRPDLYIERIDPPVQIVKTHNEGEIWRESGYMLDAKYYKPRNNPKAPSEPVKRMLTDLELTGTKGGALLFAFLEPPTKSEDEGAGEDLPEPSLQYEISATVSDVRTRQQRTIAVHRITPGGNSLRLQDILRGLLQTAHQQLAPAPPVDCHGFFLDSATSNSDGIGRFDAKLLGLSATDTTETSNGGWLVCPKPHLGLGRADIVHHEQDCLKNPHVCHLLGVKDTASRNFRKPVLIPRKIEDLPGALNALKSSTGVEDEPETIKAIEREFRDFTRRYAEMSGADLNYYIRQFRDNFLHDIAQTHPLLTREHCETLALGKFLWEQLDKIDAPDFRVPVCTLAAYWKLWFRRRFSPAVADWWEVG
jgi:hypothetical protein